MTFIKSHDDPVYPVNRCFTQIFEWRTKNTSFVTIFPLGCTEFPENSLSFPCSEKSLSIPGFQGLWPPCFMIRMLYRHMYWLLFYFILLRCIIFVSKCILPFHYLITHWLTDRLTDNKPSSNTTNAQPLHHTPFAAIKWCYLYDYFWLFCPPATL